MVLFLSHFFLNLGREQKLLQPSASFQGGLQNRLVYRLLESLKAVTSIFFITVIPFQFIFCESQIERFQN